MGFLTKHSGTEKIDVGDGYWVEVKRCLDRAQMEHAERLLTSAMTKRHMGQEIQGDTSDYRTYIVCSAIAAWNLDDDDGTVWPCNNDAAIRRGVLRMPNAVFDTIFARVDDLNSPESPRERETFREAGDGRDQDGRRGAGDAGEVPLGNHAVAAVRAPSGGSGPATLA